MIDDFNEIFIGPGIRQTQEGHHGLVTSHIREGVLQYQPTYDGGISESIRKCLSIP